MKICFFPWGSLSVSFMPVDKTKWARLSEKHFCVSRTFLEEGMLLKSSKCFYRSRTLNEMFWAFRWEKAGTIVKTALYVSWTSIFSQKLKQTEFFQKCLSFSFTAKKSLQKNFGSLVKSVPILSTVTFWGKVIFLKIWFLSLWDFGLIFYALCQNKLSAIVQTNSRASARIFLEKKVLFQFLETFHRSLTLGETFQAFWWKKKEGLSNQPLTCGKRHSEGKMKTPQRFSFRVLTAEKNCRRFFGRLAIVFVEHRNTLRKTVSVKICFLSFWEFECNFSVFCKNKLSEVARISFYVSKKSNFLLTKLKLHKCLVFLYLEQKRNCKIFLADLSKMYLFCPP